ncbi:hypothetical protein [Nitrosopumilus sp.]|uniref:hypothetical protein n=1 Tax=Nitrosopumilus sp. TaxID=2024843 RepID=UPI003D135093
MYKDIKNAYLTVLFNQPDGYVECPCCLQNAEELAKIENKTLDEIGYKPNMFYRNSQNYSTHMLFSHGMFMPQCQTFMSKVLEKNCIIGFQLKPMGKKLKGLYRSMIRNRKIALWRNGKIIKWFNYVDSQDIKVSWSSSN